MPTYFVKKEELEVAVSYFRDFSCSSPLALGCFFILKGAGFSENKKLAFDTWKETLPKVIYKFSSMYDDKEEGAKFCFLFPFSVKSEIKRSDFYNPATNRRNIASRFRDTIDNSLIDYFVDRMGNRNREENTEAYLFKQTYLDYIISILDGKIELKHILSWVFRFTAFDFPEGIAITEQDFYQVLKKEFLSWFKFNDREITSIFEEKELKVVFSEQAISGDFFRELFSFDNSIVFDFVNSATAITELCLINTASKKNINKTIMYIGKNPKTEYILESLDFKKQLILYGSPGTSKTFSIINKIMPEFDSAFTIQFHPSTTYEEFIGGTFVKGDSKFYQRDGILLKAIKEANIDTTKKILLFIDEINRGNITSILGESIIALDRGNEVEILNYKAEDEDNNLKLSIPDNLRIIATMNSSDRSISIEDKAILRRFFKMRFYVNYEILEKMTDASQLEGINIPNYLKRLNEDIVSETGEYEFQIGQAYFMPTPILEENRFVWTKISFVHVFNEGILPLVEEFTVGNNQSYKKIIGIDFGVRYYDFEKIKELILDEAS